jgi:hypothetical protein
MHTDMTRPAKSRSLSAALIAMLPVAEVISAQDSPWHSATFSGIKCQIILQLPGQNAAGRAEQFSAELPDTEFDLRRYIVADISVTDTTEQADRMLLTIEALLLDN